MATKTKVIGLNAFLKATEKQLMKFWVGEQNRLLIEYAKKEIVKLGKNIEAYHSRNHMDRTGNLLNSLCGSCIRRENCRQRFLSRAYHS